jgi:hypothetical protein
MVLFALVRLLREASAMSKLLPCFQLMEAISCGEEIFTRIEDY